MAEVEEAHHPVLLLRASERRVLPRRSEIADRLYAGYLPYGCVATVLCPGYKLLLEDGGQLPPGVLSQIACRGVI